MQVSKAIMKILARKYVNVFKECITQHINTIGIRQNL
jgi:hypothetical protein